MSDIATKAGARFSASTKALLKALRDDGKAHAQASADFFTKMADYYKALGMDDEAEVMDEAADEAEDMEAAAAGDDPEDEAPAVKAIDYHTLAEMVEEAVCEAVCEVGLAGRQEDHGGMGPMAASVAADLGEDDEPEVYVYPKYAVACTERGDYQIPYTVEAGAIVIATPGEWKRVEKEWKVVAGAEAPAPSDGPPASVMGGAIKMLDDGTIVAQAIAYGDAEHPDMSVMNDYFTKSTDLWLGRWAEMPMLYHHGMDEKTRNDPVIGTWTKTWADDAGVWMQGQLDKAHRYHAAIKELARRGLLRISTDSAPHLVQRVPQPNGTNEIKVWPVYAASLTPTPAEPRLVPAEVKAILAECGLSIATTEADDTTDHESADGRKVADEDALRLAAAELALFELENLL